MKRLIPLVIVGLLTTSLAFVHSIHAAPPQYEGKGSVNVAPLSPQLTAVDPLVYAAQSEIIPPRPFLYSVDKNGLTITRFNDNQVVGTWPWPNEIWITQPNGGQMAIPKPAGGWDPVGMTVSYPTALEFANRVKEIPDLTPPFTYVYVVMARSGYEWKSSNGAVRDTLVPSTNPDTESSILVQINVSDPSFSANRDPVAPVPPHVAGAILGHGAGQPVYDRKTSKVYVGNMPSNSLPANLASFVSVIGRIPDTVAPEETEVPGISIPVIRCGPQHPENGIPVGKPQAFACYDPSGTHAIDDNEHVGASGDFEWEFRNLPDWVTAHTELATGKLDGILYGTPPTTGEWYAEARVHNLDDPYGVFSYWTPVRLLVTTSAEYLPISSQFAVGTPVAYPLEGTGSCTLTGAPAWVEVAQVSNGCIVMGRAPLAGEHYNFVMPDFKVAGYPTISVVFNGNVVGGYGFVPLPEGVGLSGLGWHQVDKYADPSTEPAVLSLEFIGVEPSTGQLYRILPPPGKPQPPNERPPETALTIDTVSAMGLDLGTALLAARPDIAGHLVRFGDVAVEADRDIFVAAVTDSTIAEGALMKVSGTTISTISTINLPGVQAYYLDLDSDLRPAIIGVEPGQVDHGSLLVTGTTTGNVAVVDTAAGSVVQSLTVPDASSLGGVSVDFGTRYAYVAAGSLQNVAIFGPQGSTRPPMEPRIWSSEEFTWNRGYPGSALLVATGEPVPTLSLLGALPAGLTYVDNGDGTATLSGTPGSTTEGDYALALTATNATGTYAQAFGISVQTPPAITSGNAVTFTAGSGGAFTVTGTGWPTPIFYTWDEALLPNGVQLVDNEDGTASLVGIPEAAGTYVFTINATTGCPLDAAQTFTLTVNPAETRMAPAFTSPNTFTWEILGAPFPPDPVTVSVIGSPTPLLTASPSCTNPSQTNCLPFGVTFTDNGNGTATLAGTPWAEGSFPFTITATNTEGAATQTFTLIVGPMTSMMSATPESLSFAYTFGGTMPTPQTVSVNTQGDTLATAVTTTAEWLVATPVSGMAPGNVSVSADPLGLAPGTYTGTVIVNSAGTEGPPATVAVSLTVSDVPLMSVTPSVLSFEYAVAHHTIPPAQTVSLTSGGVPLNYTMSTSAAWLAATPLSGTTPGSASVSVNASRLGFGTYIGTVTIDAAGAGNGPQKLTVTLIKTQKKLDYSFKVSLDVGSGPEGLAINSKTHQLFINTSNEAGAEPNSSDETVVEKPDPAGANAVFRFDPSTEAVKGRILVHSEGEYLAVNSATGRVYHASQGTSEIAVIDGLTDTIVGYIPLLFEEGAYMPYQIAIDEKQNLIYVGAKAPPIPDPIPAPGKPFPCKAIHEMPDDEYDCWNPGEVFVIDGTTNQVVSSFPTGDDPEGVVFAAAAGKVYVSNEDDGSVTVAQGAKRNHDGSITPPEVLSTIIRGEPVPGWWQPTCDANNYCGERGQAALWPQESRCSGIDDEAEEADKMAVDKYGNVYVIDDRYRVAKIDGSTDRVVKVLEIEGFDCEAEVPDGSNVVFRNTANNIAFSDVGNGLLYVTSEQDTVSVIDPFWMELKQTITVPGAIHLDAIATDPKLNRVYITDEDLGALWILEDRRSADGSASAQDADGTTSAQAIKMK